MSVQAGRPLRVQPTHSNAGASAWAEYARRLARHKAEMRRLRPVLLSLAVAAFLLGMAMVLGHQLAGWGIAVGGVVVAARLVITPRHITAWAKGAEGEQRTAALLDPLEAEGFRVLHDRHMPGSRANVDHIVIGPPGIVVVETKSLTGRLSVNGSEVYVSGRRRTGMIEEAIREAAAVRVALGDEIDRFGWPVQPILCVHRASLPWFGATVRGVPIMSGRTLVRRLRKAQMVMTSDDVERVAALAGRRLRPVV